jgi:competence protein ComEA
MSDDDVVRRRLEWLRGGGTSAPLIGDAPDPPARRLVGGPGPFDPGRTGIRALAVVAVVVVLVAAFFAYRARPRVEPVDAGSSSVVDTGSSSSGAGPSAAGSGSSGSSSSESGPPASSAEPGSASAEVVVAVSGKVRRPGLVRLPAGARVADAVAAAGGAQPGADLTTLNLARRLVDGELIPVGVPTPPGAVAGPGAVDGGKVNINTATLAELDTLPGVGQVLAQRILDYRGSRGGFGSVGELRNVDGIGTARFEELKDLVTT